MRHGSRFDRLLWWNLNAMLIVLIVTFWGGMVYCIYKMLEMVL